MSGLREALEKVRADLEERAEQGEPYLFLNLNLIELQEILDDYPAEPAPVAEVIHQTVTDAAAVRRCPVRGYDNAWCMRPALHDGKHEWAEAEVVKP